MKISGNRAPSLPAPEADAAGEAGLDQEIEGALLKKSQNQMKEAGAAALTLIDQAADIGVNKPLNWGPVGRTINVKA